MFLVDRMALIVINTELARLGVRRKEVDIDVGFKCSRYLVEWADGSSASPLFCVSIGPSGKWEVE